MGSKNTSIYQSEKKQNVPFLFGKRNYLFMGIGIACIILGFFLMTGHDANTQPDGTYDPTYWNEDIYSFTRIRLAPILIIIGFVLEVYAILTSSKETE
ncbi:DUF3098 domain-containing protein [Weeksella sp. HMSC059D05]|uniref:DUF3098 domain-containing protein n=1 Tax=Weeksella sp. HMSC059D05 TaxID=1715139 RepID=UPI0008A2B690|nr:DUF3098 domain-containing protein [Weeksella sp. HMSC059D05]OFM81695.1 hypothetical protein HMPREF2660_00295 [Weeksella sp. HMSC059D05]